MESFKSDEILRRVERNELTLMGKNSSACCDKPTIIVRSRGGGFVTQNCSRCGVPRSIRLDELPTLSCSSCQIELHLFKRQNYFYECPVCKREWQLAHLVPHWRELFDECGFYLDGDSGASDFNSYVDATAILASFRKR